MTKRDLPADMAHTWSRLPAEPPLEALATSQALRRQLEAYQAALVHEALAGGAGWEEIGAVLGTSKQGAWARFRGGEEPMQDRQDVRRRMSETWDAGQKRLRELEAAWRQEQDRLHQELRQSKDRLTEARRRHALERREARQQIRREVEAIRG